MVKQSLLQSTVRMAVETVLLGGVVVNFSYFHDFKGIMTQNEENLGSKAFKICVKEFAKVSAAGNGFDSDILEISKEADDCEEQSSCETVSDDEIDEPVSPPACSEQEYPGLVISGDSEEKYKGLFDITRDKLLSVTPIQQKKLFHLKSQLSCLSPIKLQELTTALKNHVRKVQEPTVSVRPTVKSLVSWKTENVSEQSSDERRKEEGGGKLSLIPLTISEVDQTARKITPDPAMTFTTLHMSGGMVTMADTSTHNRRNHVGIDWRGNNETKKRYNDLICDEKTERKQIEPPILTKASEGYGTSLNEALPTVLPTLNDDQNLKRKSDRLTPPVSSKMRKVVVAEEKSVEVFKEEPVDVVEKDYTNANTEENTDIKNGNSICNPNNARKTNWSDSNYKTGKPKPITSKDPLPGLEQFIQELLNNPKSNPKIVSWENVDEGVFRITSLEAFYQIWRELKNVPIRYELLKKYIKLCEESETLHKIPKTRCVYMFGKNAKDWKPKTAEKSFDTFECKLVFPAQDTEKAILKIENNICVEIDREVFRNVMIHARK